MLPADKERRWGVLGKALLFIAACAVILAFVSAFTSQLAQGWNLVATGTVSSLGAFALTFVFLRRDRLRLEDAGAAPRSKGTLHIVAGFVAGLALVALQTILLAIFYGVRFERVQTAHFGAILLALSGYLALACREELAFHGYALRRLEQAFGLWGAQLIVAFVFAIEHVIGGVSLVHSIFGAAVGSLLFGMAALATRGLAVPIGMHAAWNFGQWMLGEKDVPGLWHTVAQTGQDRASSVCYVVVMITAMLAFWRWYAQNTSVRALAVASKASFE